MSANDNNNESEENNFYLFNEPNPFYIHNEIPNMNHNKNNLNYNKKLSEEELLRKKEEEEKEKEKNDIRDKLKCFICYGKVVNAMMCPYCKKLACEQCFKKILEKKNVCSYCNSILPFNELVKLPMLDDFTNFFINNMEQNNENENYEEDKDNELLLLRKQKCLEHPNKYIEYICMNCNEYLCSESLLVFNKESLNKHNNHIILSFDDIEKFKLYKIVKEYRKLPENKNKLNLRNKALNNKIDEIYKRQSEVNYIFDKLKVDILSKYENKISKLKSLSETLKHKKREIFKIVKNRQNLINELNNEEKCKKFLEEIKNLNKISPTEQELEKESNFKKEIKCEQYESPSFEIILANNGKYIDEYTIINKELYFIPNIKCKLICKLLLNNYNLTLSLKIDKKFLNEHSEKFIAYLITECNNIKKSKFIDGILMNDELIFSEEYEYEKIKKIINENNKYFGKFLIIKYYYK